MSYTLAQAVLPVLDRAIARATTTARSGSVHRTGRPIHGGSKLEGSFEDTFWRAPAKGEGDRQLRALKLSVDQGKRLRHEMRTEGRELSMHERLLTNLTDTTVRVFEELTALARACKGELFPSYDTLAVRISRSRNSVWRAISALEALGFVSRQRRFKRVKIDGPGPRYEQTSNVYRLQLPEWAQKLLPFWLRKAPKPDDQIQREEDRLTDQAHMLSRLSCRDQAKQLHVLTDANDTGLLAVLERLGASIDAAAERESQKQTAPLNEVIYLQKQPSWPSRPTPTA
jgi:predicted transcriptional regulator